MSMTKGSFAAAPPAYSTIPPAAQMQFSVCCISLNMSDRIRLLGCPAQIVPPIREAIKSAWGQIQSESSYCGAHEFKLLGNPWYGQSQDAVYARRLLTALLRTMAQCGWNLLQASDVSKKPHDKDTMFFESAVAPDPDAQLFAVSFNMSDRIRVIDAPAFMPFVKTAVQAQWKYGIQEERDYYGSKELKLRGNPWFASGDEAVLARMLCAQICANIRAQGFKLYASVDISVGTDKGHDLETWVFRRVGPSWQ
ncbi:hypothetical protein DFQ26_002488 [Actinomortierella ambigua]|nr:hypothetical protein DFQ26_002488 [Actinomortierella ambigua]